MATVPLKPLPSSPLAALELAVATYSGNATKQLNTLSGSVTWKETAELAKAFADGQFFSILHSRVGQQLLEEDEAGFLTGDGATALKFQQLVALLRLRALRFLQAWEMQHEEDSSIADDRRLIAYQMVIVAAALLALYSQENVTGPEIDSATLQKEYPPALLRRACEKPFEGSAKSTITKHTVVSSTAPSDSAGTDASRVTMIDEEEAEDMKRNDKLLQRMTRRREEVHQHLIHALSVSGDEAYELLRVPGYLLVARALLVAITRPPPGAATAANVGEECAALWGATDGLLSVCWWYVWDVVSFSCRNRH